MLSLLPGTIAAWVRLKIQARLNHMSLWAPLVQTCPEGALVTLENSKVAGSSVNVCLPIKGYNFWCMHESRFVDFIRDFYPWF